MSADRKLSTILPFRLRLAGHADAAEVLRLRNEPHTRAMSINQMEVKPKQHERWFEETLSNTLRRLFVAMEDGHPHVLIAVCRFDIDLASAEVETSINLAAAVQGRRLSSPILCAAIELMQQEAPSVAAEWFVARVRSENHASLKLFERCGFVRDSERSTVECTWFRRRFKHFRTSEGGQ